MQGWRLKCSFRATPKSKTSLAFDTPHGGHHLYTAIMVAAAKSRVSGIDEARSFTVVSTWSDKTFTKKHVEGCS